MVNPARRTLEEDLRRRRGLLSRARAQLCAKAYPTDGSAAQVGAFEREKGQWLEEIRQHEAAIIDLKKQRSSTPQKIPLSQLPPEERFTPLPAASKHFVDTIKMIAYRAETALAGCVAQKLQRADDDLANFS